MNVLAMEQQVNLHQPILGAEKRLFSARTIGSALLLFAVSLATLSAYASRRISSIEREVEQVERRQAANVAMAVRVGKSVRPAESLEQLESESRALAADIDARTRVLVIVRHDGDSPTTGFAARLEALAQRQLDGVWLTAVVEGSGEGRLAMRGSASDPGLIPAYLAGLADQPALHGVRLDRLSIRRATAAEAPAQVVFEADGPGLEPSQDEHPK